jgi:hypothetical protein
MDIARLGISYAPQEAAAPTASVVSELKCDQQPELELPETNSLQLNRDRLEFYHSELPNARPLFSLKIEQPDYSQPGPHQQELGGFRSPFLQKQAQNLGKEHIQTPLKDAWQDKVWDSTSVRAAGLGLGAAAIAVCAPTEIKSRLTVLQTEIGDLKLKSGLRVTSGHGDLNFSGAKLSLSPNHSNDRKSWNLDLEYDPQDDRLGLAFQRSVSRIQVGPSSGVSYLQAGVSNDSKQGALGRLSYNLNY